MRALVTGGAGFIGTNLIKRLLKDKNKVFSVDNYTTGLEENHQDKCQYINFDIRQNTENWFLEDIDVIFHLAALPRIGPSFNNPTETLEVNVKA